MTSHLDNDISIRNLQLPRFASALATSDPGVNGQALVDNQSTYLQGEAAFCPRRRVFNLDATRTDV